MLAVLLVSAARPTQAQTYDARIGRYVNGCFPTGQPSSPNKAANRSGTFNSTYGAAFTPRGSMKILVIFAGFTEAQTAGTSCGNYSNPEWPQVDGIARPYYTLPANLSDYFYTSSAQFSSAANDHSISNYLYQMSQTAASPLPVTFGVFPNRINIPASGRSIGDIAGYSEDVLNAIRVNYPTFDWSPYDQRANDPGFNFDSSTTGPDGKLDYVVICFRPGCGAGLPGSTGMAYMPTVTFPATKHNPAYTTGTGHLMVSMGMNRNLFLHELAHTLYGSPHLFSANGTVGQYFYGAAGWGMMQSEITLYASNAWERWHLGWTELQTSNGSGGTISSDITGPGSLTATNGYYTLRDYTTTGDVVRIKLPNAGNQYLWLENHARPASNERQSRPCDRRVWYKVFYGPIVVQF